MLIETYRGFKIQIDDVKREYPFRASVNGMSLGCFPTLYDAEKDCRKFILNIINKGE